MRSGAVTVTGVAVASCLGRTGSEHQARMDQGLHGLRPLGELNGMPPQFAALGGGWIEPRSWLAKRRYAPASNLAVALARAAVEDAGLPPEALRDAWLLVGSSRGNLAGWLAPWPGRRPVRLMATSNSMHSELATSVSIELGIRGPYQVLANGCSSGLDAIGLGYIAVASGMAPRVLAVSVDLPLLNELLTSFAQTGLLSSNGVNDPYSPSTTGFLPAEGGAALVIEPPGEAETHRRYGDILGYWANSDAYDPLGLPADGAGIADCLRDCLKSIGGADRVSAICPHASGTVAHGQAEHRALHEVFGRDRGNGNDPVTLHLMKPFTGHTLGASGAIDTAIVFYYLRRGLLPPNLPNLTGSSLCFDLPATPIPADDRIILKISAGMGGHNAVTAIRQSSP